MKKQFRAFTLVELSIVLMVIGVIAALTIPTLGNKVDKNKGLFKKTYSSIERIAGELVNDETYYRYDEQNFGFSEPTDVEIVGLGYYTSTTDSPKTSRMSNFGNRLIKFCNLFSSQLNLREKLKFNSDSECTFTTNDGVAWKIIPQSEDKNTTVGDFFIDIDVNGAKAPNADGNAKYRDKFRIKVHHSGQVSVPDDDELEKKYLSSTEMNEEEREKE